MCHGGSVSRGDGGDCRPLRTGTAAAHPLEDEDTGGRNPRLSLWTTSNYTLKKALEDSDSLAENRIDYVGGFVTNLDVFKPFDFATGYGR